MVLKNSPANGPGKKDRVFEIDDAGETRWTRGPPPPTSDQPPLRHTPPTKINITRDQFPLRFDISSRKVAPCFACFSACRLISPRDRGILQKFLPLLYAVSIFIPFLLFSLQTRVVVVRNKKKNIPNLREFLVINTL